MKKLLVILMMASMLLSSCATALRSPNEPLTIRTNVPRATVQVTATVPYRIDPFTAMIDGFHYTGTAPMMVDLPRNGSYDVIVSKEGYIENSAVVVPKLGPKGILFSAGNILFGGIGIIIGGAVDVSSGAIYQHSTRNLYLPLQPVEK